MPPGIISNIFKHLSKQSIANFPETEQDFAMQMASNQELSHNVYKLLKEQGVENLPDSHEGFRLEIFPPKKKDSLASSVPAPTSVSTLQRSPLELATGGDIKADVTRGAPTPERAPTPRESFFLPGSPFDFGIIQGLEGKPSTPAEEAELKRRLMEDPAKETNPLVTPVKSVWNLMSNQLPGLVAGGAVAASRKLTQGMSPLERHGIDTGKRTGEVFVGPEGYNIYETTGSKPNLDEAVLEWANERMQKGERVSQQLITRLSDVHGPIDLLNWFGSAGAQLAGQVPAAILTGGGTAFGQAVGDIYLGAVNRIAQEKGLTPEMVINLGLDSPGIALAYGSAAGALDYLGARRVGKAFTRTDLASDLKSRGLEALKTSGAEGSTEYFQQWLQQLGTDQAAGQDFQKAWGNANTAGASMDRLEAMAAGLVAGPLAAVAQAGQPEVRSKPGTSLQKAKQQPYASTVRSDQGTATGEGAVREVSEDTRSQNLQLDQGQGQAQGQEPAAVTPREEKGQAHVKITSENFSRYIDHLEAGGTLHPNDLIDLRRAIYTHFRKKQEELSEKISSGEVKFKDAYKKDKTGVSDKLSQETMRLQNIVSSQPNSYGLAGDANAPETYHFTDPSSAIGILEDDLIYGEGESPGVSTTTNREFDHPELTQTQWYGEGNKPITFANKGVRIDLDLEKLKSDKKKIRQGSEDVGTFEGEQELRIGGYRGLEGASKYIKQIEVNTQIVSSEDFAKIKELADLKGIKVVEKTNFQRTSTLPNELKQRSEITTTGPAVSLQGERETSERQGTQPGPAQVSEQVPERGAGSKKIDRGLIPDTNKTWSIITADNPVGQSLGTNAELRKDLEALGLTPVEVTGRYGGRDEASFYVPGLTREQAVELAKKYGQESVMTNEGMAFSSGELQPITSQESSSQLTDNYTDIGGRRYSWSVGQQNLINNTKTTQGFFSDVVTGKSDKFKPVRPYRPIMSFTRIQNAFNEAYSKFKGLFDEHIATSIPGFRDVQVKKGRAIIDMLPEGGLMIDIAGSEGGLNKAITQESGGRIKTINLDVNPDMRRAHEASPVRGAEFEQSSFLQDYSDETGSYKKFTPKEKADVVHESMGFQFMSPQRKEQFREIAKNYLKADGALIVEEKMGNREWEANEAKKDSDFKSRFYTKQQIEEKNKAVKVSDFDANEGMAGNMVTEDIVRRELEANFKYVQQYWDAGNFKGYIASNNLAKINSFMDSMGSTTTEFSNRSDAELYSNIPSPGPETIQQSEPKNTKPPEVSSQDLKNLEEKYRVDNNITTPVADIDQKFSQADISAVDKLHKESPDRDTDPAVEASYRAFMNETMQQYQALVDAGYKIEPYMGEGEPYGVASDKVREDLNKNKHLSYLRTASAIGDSDQTKLGDDYILLEDTGLRLNGDKVSYNDLFRAVHDVMGHGIYNNTFSTQGEYRAYLTHSNMYSPEAQMALFLETVAYNAYYAKNKKYAPRKLYKVPQEMIDRLRGVQSGQQSGQTVQESQVAQPKSGQSAAGARVAFEWLGTEMTGTVIGPSSSGKIKVKGDNGTTYIADKVTPTSKPAPDAKAPAYSGKTMADTDAALKSITDKYAKEKEDTKKKTGKGGILPVSINPFPILRSIWNAFQRGQELTFGAMAKTAEDWVSKMANLGVTSRNYFVRSGSNLARNLMGGIPYNQTSTIDKRKLEGNKNYAHFRAKVMMEDMYGMVDDDLTALERVHQVLDPEAYNKSPQAGQVPTGTQVTTTGPVVIPPNALPPGPTQGPPKLTYADLNASEQALHDMIRSVNDFVHEWSYQNGFITEETYQKYKGRYIGRFYEEFELGDPEFEATIKASRAEFSMYKQRQNEVALQILKDPVFATARRIAQVLQNQAIFDYADAILKSGIPVSDTPQPGMSQLGPEMRPQRPGVVPAGTQFTKFTPGSRPYYGKLTGKYVPNYIAEDFKGFFFANELLQKLYAYFRGYDKQWIRQLAKKSHTVYNPIVQLGNFTANFSFAFWAGVDPFTFTANMATASSEIANKGDFYQQAIREGIINSDVLSKDIKPLVAQGQSGAKGVLGSLDSFASNAYQWSDNVSKLSAYISLINMGRTPAQAAQGVFEGFQNYATVGKAYDFAAKTPVFGNPYIKFKADLARIIKNSVTRRPLTTGVYLALLSGLKDWLSEISGEDEETQKIREGRSYIPKIRTPFGDIAMTWMTPVGEVNFARFLSPYFVYDKGTSDSMLSNVSDWLPYQFETVQSPFSKDVVTGWPEFADVLLGSFAQLISDRDFRGKSIADPSGNRFKTIANNPKEQWMNRLYYISRSQIPFFRSADDFLAAWNGEPDYYNRERTIAQAILNNIIKIQEFEQPQVRRYLENEIQFRVARVNDISRNISALKSHFQMRARQIHESKTADKQKLMKKEYELFMYRFQHEISKQADLIKELQTAAELAKGLK